MKAKKATVKKTWTRDGARALIYEIISDLVPNAGEPYPAARLIEDMSFQSLSLLELAFSLEDEFDLPTIDEACARRILTVDDVEQHVYSHLTSTGQLVA